MRTNDRQRGRWVTDKPSLSALTDHERTAGLDDWAARERQANADRVAQLAAEQATRDARAAAVMARALAVGCDNGAGVCQFCGVELGSDDTDALTHPDNGCPGPRPTCERCGKPWKLGAGGRYEPACSAAEHAQRDRDTAWALATRERNPLVAPPRAYKDGDDDD